MKALSMVAVGILAAAVLAGCTQPATNTTVDSSTGRIVPTYGQTTVRGSPIPRVPPAVPGIVGVPFVAQANETAMTIRWTMTVSGGLQPGQAVYSQVRITSANGTSLVSPDQVGLGQRDAIFTGLQPHTDYRIEVLVHVSGNPPVSPARPFLFTTGTDPYAPPPPPAGNVTSVGNVTVADITPNDPPELGGPGSSADVHFFVVGDPTAACWVAYGLAKTQLNQVSPRIFGSGGQVISLTGLDPSHDYFAQVICSAGGHSVQSAVVEFHIPETPHTGTPIRPTPTDTPQSSGSIGSPATVSFVSLAQVDAQASWDNNVEADVQYTVGGSGSIAVALQYIDDASWLAAGGTFGAAPPQSNVSPQSAGTGSVAAQLAEDTVYHLRLKANNGGANVYSPEVIVWTWNVVHVNVNGVGKLGSVYRCQVTNGGAIDPLDDQVIRITNNDPLNHRHEWILLDTASGGGSPTILVDSDGSMNPSSGTATGRATGLWEPTGVTLGRLPVPPTTFGTPQFRMVTNQPVPDSPTMPFWTTAGGGSQYDVTGRPGPLVQPSATVGPPGTNDICGFMPMRLAVGSGDFQNGGTFPNAILCATGRSPSLQMVGVDPALAAAYAFELIDNTAGGTPVWFWWDIGAGQSSVPAGTGGVTPITSMGGKEGPGGYTPPCPATQHHYELDLYALNAPLGLPNGSTYTQFQSALFPTSGSSPVVQQASIVGFS